MATLAEIRTAIAIRLQDPTYNGVSSASIDQAINDAVDYYKKNRYSFNESVVNLTMTTGNGMVSGLPLDFYQEVPNGVNITYSNIRYPLQKVDSAEFDTQNINGVGMPYVYTYRNGGFEFYYLPQQDFPLTIRYLKNYPALSGDSASNDFTVNAPLMIRYNALSRIYAEFKQDEKMEAYYSARAESEENQIKRHSAALTATGRLTVYDSIYY